MNNAIDILNFSHTPLGIDNAHVNSLLAQIANFDGLFVTIANNWGNNLDNANSIFHLNRANNTIVVGASLSNGRIRGPSLGLPSGFGRYSVDIFAPGHNNIATHDWRGQISCPTGAWNGGRFQSVGATSNAAPFVAGTAALMLSVNPNLTPSQMRDILRNTVTPIAASHCYFIHNHSVSRGVLNAHAAVIQAYNLLRQQVTLTPIWGDWWPEYEISVNPNVQIQGNFIMPSRIRDREITRIAANAFANQPQLSQISIPATINSLGSNVFHSNTHVHLAHGWISIPAGLFAEQTTLSQISIPATVGTTKSAS